MGFSDEDFDKASLEHKTKDGKYKLKTIWKVD